MTISCTSTSIMITQSSRNVFTEIITVVDGDLKKAIIIVTLPRDTQMLGMEELVDKGLKVAKVRYFMVARFYIFGIALVCNKYGHSS